MRWLTSSVQRRVALAALAGLIAGIIVLALLASFGASLVVAAIVAGIATVAAASIAARSLTGPIERLAASSERDRRFDTGGPREIEALGAALRRMTAALEDARRGAEAERDRLATLLDELGEAILIAGEDGRIERANRAAAELFGADLAGRRLVEVIRDHELLEAIGAARPDKDTVVTVERSDPPRFQRAIARRLGDRRLLLVVQELTAMRRLETVRREFVANVSHELRTPIASLKAMAQTLESGALEDREAATDFIRRMQGEIDGLAELVEELLLISRLESGQQVLALAPARPADLVESAARRLSPLVQRAGLRLVVDPTDRLPPVVVDPDRVAQVFANLVHNATKHTPPGGEIRLSASRAGDRVAFEVRDTGDGILPGDVERIFERFYKSDRSRADGGTGLGLSIAKHIVEAHGGSIRASSAGPGRGASFTFTLPVSKDR
jgi:two-component system phosphate regulon sensor histidine kinase PhoR